MKHLSTILLVVLLASGCGKTPPNLTPAAVAAFHGTQVIQYLDRVRDAANDAHKTVPPLLDAQVTLKIVNWHQSAITVVHATPAGWQATVTASLDELMKGLNAHDQQVVAPYIAAAKLVIHEVH